jgi:hypothetical protein
MTAYTVRFAHTETFTARFDVSVTANTREKAEQIANAAYKQYEDGAALVVQGKDLGPAHDWTRVNEHPAQKMYNGVVAEAAP